MIKVKADADSIFKRSISSKAALWSPSHEQWRYIYALRALNGKELVPVGPVSGIGGHVYALLPEGDEFKKYQSRVIALAEDLVESVDMSDARKPPYEQSRYAEMHEEKGNHVVRILCGWVDGFSGFSPVER